MAGPEVADAALAAAAAFAAAVGTEVPEANSGLKRGREEGDDSATGAAAEEAPAKKAKMEGKEKEAEDLVIKGEEGKTVMLAPKEFVSAVEMYDYFSTLLESWSPHLNFNMYEYMVLEDLVKKKGHAEPSQMIGAGIEAFGIRHHPKWESRCFFVRRVDGTIDDFSFRKCVNKILSLPRGLSTLRKSNGNKGGGGRGGGGRGGGGGSLGGGGYRGRGTQGN